MKYLRHPMIHQALADHGEIRLELGCGEAKRDPDAIGIDLLDRPGVDVIADVLDVLADLPDECATSISSEHFLEHVTDPEALVREAARVLTPGGKLNAVVPHFSNPWFYSDPTHSSWFGLYTFAYWVQDQPYRRRVPNYSTKLPLRLDSARHVFKSNRPFLMRHALKKIFSSWVNASGWTQEFYEEHLVWVMPCYEIEYRLTKI